MNFLDISNSETEIFDFIRSLKDHEELRLYLKSGSDIVSSYVKARIKYDTLSPHNLLNNSPHQKIVYPHICSDLDFLNGNKIKFKFDFQYSFVIMGPADCSQFLYHFSRIEVSHFQYQMEMNLIKKLRKKLNAKGDLF